METLREMIVRIAHEHPEMRVHLVPLLHENPDISKAAKVFPNEKARHKYMMDHPNANPRNHTVAPPDVGTGKTTPEQAPSAMKSPAAVPGKQSPAKAPSDAKAPPPKGTAPESWKDFFKSLPSKVVSYIKNAPVAIRRFVHDDQYRQSVLDKTQASIKAAPKQFVKDAFHAAKHEVKEFDEAHEGIKAWMHGKKMSKEQAEAFEKVLTHVAIASIATALETEDVAGITLMGAAVGKTFIMGLGKKIVAEGVAKKLEKLPLYAELGEIGHHGFELLTGLMEKLGSKKPPKLPSGMSNMSSEDVMQLLIAAAVAKGLKNITPAMLREVLEEAAKDKA